MPLTNAHTHTQASYLKEAEKYAVETQLTQRVSHWQAYMEPVMQEEETHEPFDIDVYGVNILDSLSTLQLDAKKSY